MQGNVWNDISHFFGSLQNNPLVVAIAGVIVGAMLTTIGFLFREIWNMLTRLTSWLWAFVRKQGKEHHFEQMYLSWLIREHRHLSLLPAQLVARLWRERQKLSDLEKVFVKLSMSTQSGDERWAETYGDGENTWRKRPWIGLRALKTLLRLLLLPLVRRSSLFTEPTYQPGDLALVIDRHKRLVLRGDPGSGKTTLLRHLALTCARALRNDRRDGDARDLVKQRFLWTQRPFPILVRLRRHANVTSWDEAKELTDILIQEMPPELRKRCPPDFFERHLQRGNCLLMLDAFDELGTPDARMAMARKIAGFLEIYQRQDNRIIVTTRIVGYEGQLEQYDFTVRNVQQLKAGETRALVKQRYAAIAIAETTGKSDQETRDIEHKMKERAERLIEKVEQTPRLTQLATNPLLLSLIVLVHSLKFELPEERLLLYRDCVEILAEGWQRFKREEAGLKKEDSEREELALNQKLVLLCELAFVMQQHRKDEGSPALLPKEVARDLLAQKLPDLLGGALPQDEPARGEASRHEAEKWLTGIQQGSGILVEQGLDEAGEPLISFSHLTFQEYLAAVALHETESRQSLLHQHLFEPAWQEVILLYAALVSDATPLITALLKPSASSYGVLLAGRCLAQPLKKVQTDAQQTTLAQLKEGFSNADDDQTIDNFGKVMGLLSGSDITTFMRQHLGDPSAQKRLAAIKALGETRADAPELDEVRADLVSLLETPQETTITRAAREALAQIGDPRFTGPEPLLVPVPAQPSHVPALMRTWKDLQASAAWKTAKGLRQRFNMVARIFDYWLFARWQALRHRPIHGYPFEIGKYPVTNIEYRRFIEATSHPMPESWQEGTFAREEATYPVMDITREDAFAYCRWLNSKTGQRYRLPTEWEWEWAAAGPNGWKYPWGDQFEKERCNTKESGSEGVTPVGSYILGKSFCEASDMVGNVWEITSASGVEVSVAEKVLSRVGSKIELIAVSLFSTAIGAIVGVVWLGAIGVVVFFVLFVLLDITKTAIGVVRGGAWDTSHDEATCFFRKDATGIEFVGLRCVKEIDTA